MKKNWKKLSISRETLLNLDSLDKIAGGEEASVGSAMLNCDTWDRACDPYKTTTKPPAA